ncbi:NERD domain-containing protein [Massilia scottii]|uniref:NERD domain-containing protein n=1 Tax=Massilia scottii TaxID=3057166 RepID=UPI00279679E4|nr:NERD domain-containing protein [Massilia sp. CCM 9029]MDQ1835420.1 NERD domain-containing protein [Massilia sp. CCM 9029]
MIIKNADDKSSAIGHLESLLKRAEGKQLKFIEDELRMLRAGIKGEQQSAYHIDFDFRNSVLTAVIHDLRLEHNGRVAQIDHLVIHRTHKFFVLETKSFSHGVKINDDGEFLRWNDWKKTYEGLPSPIEQNRRHVEVLREVLSSLGYAKPVFESFVLISPTARIDRSKVHPCPEVVKADQFSTAYKKRLDDTINSAGEIFGALKNIVFGDSVETIAQKLVALHKPITIDYDRKFGLQGVSARVPEHTGVTTVVPIEEAPPVVAKVDIPAPDATEVAPCCKSCGGTQLAIEYGKYGYYFKCKSCAANTAPKIACHVSGHSEKIRKDKLTFYRECEQCGTSKVFYVNDA